VSWLQLQRLRYRRQVQGTPLERCWQAQPAGNRTPWDEVSYLVADGEMSSLEAAQGELLSVGWVPVEGGRVILAGARHALIQAELSVGQSATIHQLRDCELQAGSPLGEVMSRFLEDAVARVLVFHNARLDIAFLDQASRLLYGAPLLLPVLDTLRIEKTRLARRDVPLKPGDLALQGCRKRYGLPQYPAHNALMDAVATAELLIAQARHKSARGNINLADLR
jgi:DNA polymerase-3 subunit epsilon